MSVPAYRLLFYSATIVTFGVMGQAVARGWLARELTGSNTGLGGVMLAFGGAMLVSTPFGGVAADRYPKRVVLLLAVLTLMTSSLAIGVAVVTDVIEYWMLLVAGALQAAAFAFYLPARISLISELVPSELLENAVVVAQMSQEATRVVAPALAGVLIGVAWCGVGGVFIGGGLSCAFAAAFVVALPRVPRRTEPTRSPLAEMADALAYMRTDTGVGMIALLTVGVVMVGFPYLTFLPTLADDRYDVGATGFGVMSGAAGLGAVIAGLVHASRDRGARPWRTIALSGAAFGVSLIALGFSDAYPLALLALAGVGASGLVFQTSTQALMLRISPLEYHGRLQSVVILGFSGFGLAALPLGLLADAVTLRVTLAGMGAMVLLMTAGFAIVRYRYRRYPPAVEIG
jgi:MFS family permease